MPTPLPSKGTVLQTAEFADSLYSPLFVSSLYHILSYLSRGFLKFFFRWGGWDSNPQYHLLASGGCPLKPTTPKGKWLLYPAYPRHFFSLRGLVHICIPHTGTPCGRVIGLKVLPTLVGLSLWDCLALAFCTLIVSHFKGFVKRFFELFLFGREILFYFTQLRIGERLFAPVCLFTSLLYHTLGELSSLIFFREDT